MARRSYEGRLKSWAEGSVDRWRAWSRAGMRVATATQMPGTGYCTLARPMAGLGLDLGSARDWI